MIRPLSLSLHPVEAFLRLRNEPGLAYLETGNPGRDAFTFLAACPRLVRTDDVPDTILGREAAPEDDWGPDGRHPPFRHGWIGYLTYESARLWNPMLQTHTGVASAPLAWWGRYDASLAYRHADDRWLLSHTDDDHGRAAAHHLLLRLSREPGPSPMLKRARTRSTLDARSGPGGRRGDRADGPRTGARAGMQPRHDMQPRPPRLSMQVEPRSVYERRIEQVLDWIGQGHIYQANYTYRAACPVFPASSLHHAGHPRDGGSDRGVAPVRDDRISRAEAMDAHDRPLDVFLALRELSPAPFGAFLRPETDLSILSSSPELFLRAHGTRIQTCPIKGTRPRDPRDPLNDRKLALDLLQSEKDRAELTMIVDLERNDLGRICRFGSVRATAFPELESFETVHHLAATVEGQLAEPTALREVLRATFPGGSITGAPKKRAMEILSDLESDPRFVYTGALGFLDDHGDLELALTIRTMWAHEGVFRLGVGGGIVADSDPAEEWEETQTKARGMLRALESSLDADDGASREGLRDATGPAWGA